MKKLVQDLIAVGGGDKLKPTFTLTFLHVPLALMGLDYMKASFTSKAIKLYMVPSYRVIRIA